MVKLKYGKIESFFCGILICLISYTFILSDAPASKEIQPKDRPDKEFFVYLEKIGNDSAKNKEYLDIIEKISKIFINEANKNPQIMSLFAEEIISMIPRMGPGIALQMEEYANEQVNDKMSRLKRESNIEKLLALEKENASLREELHGKRNPDLSDRQILFLLSLGLEYNLRELSRLKKNAEFVQNENQKRDFSKKIDEIEAAIKKASCGGPKGDLPVLILGERFSYGIKITSLDNGECWFVSLNKEIPTELNWVIKINEGKYRIEYHDFSSSGVVDFTVDKDDTKINKVIDGKEYRHVVVLD